MPQGSTASRGRAFFDESGVSGFTHRAFTRSMGFDEFDMDGPVIGVCNTFSELNSCHRHFRELAEAVKRGIWQAGGLPLEFPTISLGEVFLSPTAMMHRNLAAMDTEEMIRAQPLDGVVLLSSCDKTTPAALMGAASADVPSIFVSGGPMLDGHFRGETLGACSDCRRLTADHTAGELSDATYSQIESHIVRSAGHCMVMGTASTMNSLTEALGVALPGNGSIPAVDSRRLSLAQRSGRRIVELAMRQERPSRFLTQRAFENAITVLSALGGSTNAIIHLTAIAGRRNLRLPLSLFEEIGKRTPVIANLRPAGQYQMEDFFHAGGVSAVLHELLPLLHQDCATVFGETIGEIASSSKTFNGEVVRPLNTPVHPQGSIAVLRGNLAPDGAIIKHAAASPRLLVHTGRARVFDGMEDLRAKLQDDSLDVEADDVLVLRGVGPIGGPGMPEVGNFPIPAKLLRAGVRDMVRISDARMSGTAFGTIVLHVAPESAMGGPLALVRDGDRISLDVHARTLELLVDEAELASRRAKWSPDPLPYERGYGRLFLEHVEPAPDGCDFDFLRGSDPAVVSQQPKF